MSTLRCHACLLQFGALVALRSCTPRFLHTLNTLSQPPTPDYYFRFLQVGTSAWPFYSNCTEHYTKSKNFLEEKKLKMS